MKLEGFHCLLVLINNGLQIIDNQPWMRGILTKKWPYSKNDVNQKVQSRFNRKGPQISDTVIDNRIFLFIRHILWFIYINIITLLFK